MQDGCNQQALDGCSQESFRVALVGQNYSLEQLETMKFVLVRKPELKYSKDHNNLIFIHMYMIYTDLYKALQYYYGKIVSAMNMHTNIRTICPLRYRWLINNFT